MLLASDFVHFSITFRLQLPNRSFSFLIIGIRRKAGSSLRLLHRCSSAYNIRLSCVDFDVFLFTSSASPSRAALSLYSQPLLSSIPKRQNAMQPSSTFTDDLVLPSRRQRWDVLLRFRSLPMNVTSLFIGVAIGKLLSGLLFPSLAEHEGCYVLWAMRAAVPLTSFGALLLFLACAVWELCVRDLSDHKREYVRKLQHVRRRRKLRILRIELTDRNEGARDSLESGHRGR